MIGTKKNDDKMKLKMSFKMKRILKRNEKRHRIDQMQLVKRALFIDGNLTEHHRQTCELLKKEMSKIEEEQSAKYNFDFKNDKPLNGNYEWVKTDNLNNVTKVKTTSNGKEPRTRFTAQGKTNKNNETPSTNQRIHELIESNYCLRSKVSSERKSYL